MATSSHYNELGVQRTSAHLHKLLQKWAGRARHRRFYRYMTRVRNPSGVSFLHHAFFTYVFALLLFRAGERLNNSDAFLAAGMKFSSLFLGLNQTLQEIQFRDVKSRVRARPEIATFINHNETFTVSSEASKGEGGDFILEAKNRKIVWMMQPGHPEQRDLGECY